MSQPKLTIGHSVEFDGEIFVNIAGEIHDITEISSARTKQTAYKRAAAKLRKLADEAERLANE